MSLESSLVRNLEDFDGSGLLVVKDVINGAQLLAVFLVLERSEVWVPSSDAVGTLEPSMGEFFHDLLVRLGVKVSCNDDRISGDGCVPKGAHNGLALEQSSFLESCLRLEVGDSDGDGAIMQVVLVVVVGKMEMADGGLLIPLKVCGYAAVDGVIQCSLGSHVEFFLV